MIHVTCDVCGCHIEEDHFIVRIDVRLSEESSELTDADLDADNLEKVSQLLKQAELDGNQQLLQGVENVCRRFDLCARCRDRFVKNPLGGHLPVQLGFSTN